MSVTNYRCDMFFEALDEVHNRLDFYQRIINSLTTGLPPALTAASVNGQAVANVAAALGFASSTLKNANELLLLAEFKPALYSRWQEARDKQRSELVTWLGNSRSVIRAELKMNLYEYARICLPTQLKAWLHDSARLGKLVSSGSGSGNGTGTASFGFNEGVATSGRPKGPRPLVVR